MCLLILFCGFIVPWITLVSEGEGWVMYAFLCCCLCRCFWYMVFGSCLLGSYMIQFWMIVMKVHSCILIISTETIHVLERRLAWRLPQDRFYASITTFVSHYFETSIFWTLVGTRRFFCRWTVEFQKCHVGFIESHITYMYMCAHWKTTFQQGQCHIHSFFQFW